jgi:hypothetical protein
MYYIIHFNYTDKDVPNLRGATLYSIVERKEVAWFQAPTASGYMSKKAILPDFEYTRYEPNESHVGLVCKALGVSDEVAQQLIAKYKPIVFKTYDLHPSRGLSCANLYQLSEQGLISDPDDTSGQFSRP